MNGDVATSADLALMGGKILTMNPSQPCAEAIAVKGERILKVGTNAEISQLLRKNTEVIRLKGKTVVPGFIDTHIHVAYFGRLLKWIDLEDVGTIKEMQNRLRRRVQAMPQEKWIMGRGWDHNRLSEKRAPTRFDLDAISPVNPVVFYHKSGQVCVVNSKALELAGLTKQTVAPSGGTIEKNSETGELTGILTENATDLVWHIIPEPSEKELIEAAVSACKKIVEAGVTSVHWIVSSSAEVSIAQKLWAQHKLPLRVYIIIPANLLESVIGSELRKDSADNALRISGVLIFADGYLAARTAALFQPYSDFPAASGSLLCTQEEMNASTFKICKANLQLIIHAMGDKAVDSALIAIEKTSEEAPERVLRSRIEQAAVLNEGLIKRIKKQKVVVSVQPRVISSEFSVWSAIDHLGIERSRWLFPLKTLLKANIRVSGGSDCPMEPLSPLLGIQAAVTREFFPEEQITVDEALQIYTVDAAYVSFEENLKGSIEKGKLADFAVISHDPRAVPPNEIGNIKVEMTIVGGNVFLPKNFP